MSVCLFVSVTRPFSSFIFLLRIFHLHGDRYQRRASNLDLGAAPAAIEHWDSGGSQACHTDHVKEPRFFQVSSERPNSDLHRDLNVTKFC